MRLLEATMVAVETQLAAMASIASAKPTLSVPAPPTSAGTFIASRPRLAASCTSSRGNTPVRSPLGSFGCQAALCEVLARRRRSSVALRSNRSPFASAGCPAAYCSPSRFLAHRRRGGKRRMGTIDENVDLGPRARCAGNACIDRQAKTRKNRVHGSAALLRRFCLRGIGVSASC